MWCWYTVMTPNRTSGLAAIGPIAIVNSTVQPMDATIVRSVLVPATMKLLGEPELVPSAWLQWLPEVSAEGGEEPLRYPRVAPTASRSL